jgi:phosphatidylglycerol:prolipoprotein diacylglycerol transferase
MGLGQAIGRIGCFLAGCDYGVRAEGRLAPFGVTFPGPFPGWEGSPAWREQVAQGLIPETAARSLPVIPAQLLSSLKGLTCFVVCLLIWRRRPRRAGTGLLAFFAVYGTLRAMIEQIRDDPGRGEILGVSTSTAIGAVTATIACALIFVPQLARFRPELGERLPAPPAEAEPAEKPGSKRKKKSA